MHLNWGNNFVSTLVSFLWWTFINVVVSFSFQLKKLRLQEVDNNNLVIYFVNWNNLMIQLITKFWQWEFQWYYQLNASNISNCKKKLTLMVWWCLLQIETCLIQFDDKNINITIWTMTIECFEVCFHILSQEV